MKIRNRLTLYFTIIFAVVIFVVLAFSYYAAVINTRKSFYTKLEERAFITSQAFLKEDEFPQSQWLPYKNKLSQQLPTEIIQMFNILNKKVENSELIALASGKINLSDLTNLPESAKSYKSDKSYYPNLFYYTKEILDRIRNEKELKYKKNDRQYYGMYYIDNQGKFVIIASAIDINGNASLHHLLTYMLIGFAVSICFIYLIGIYFAKKALEPIKNIVTQVKKITATNLKIRVDEGNNSDEISELANTFNNVLEKLETSFEIQKTFVSNASHELRTPLTAIIGELEVLLYKERDNKEYKETLTNVLGEVQQLKDFINNLLNIARTNISEENNQLEEIRIDELILEIKRDILNEYPLTKIKLEFNNLPEDASILTVHGNKNLLLAAFNNIINNALKFSNNAEITCVLYTHKKKIKLKIIDSGIGISEKDMKNIFQPFYRASNASGYPGHGVGLSLSDKIIRLHGGKINIHSLINKGTTVDITF